MKEKPSDQAKRSDKFQQFTDDDQEKQSKIHDWKPYEYANIEQPICCTCCNSCYFKYRWESLKFLQNHYVFSNYSVGFCIVFLALLLVSCIFIYETYGSSHGSSSLPTYFLILTFLIPTRNSIWLFLTGISFENFLYWHKYIAVLCIITGIFHGFSKTNLSGFVLIGLMIIMLPLSIACFRNRYFEIFFRSHWILAFLIIIASIWHQVTLYPLLLWIIDLIIRAYIVKKNQKNMKNLKIIQISPNCLKLSLYNENLKYKPGQYFFVCFPKISILEWHPINISSSPFEKNVILYIKVLGDWTQELYEIAKKEQNLSIWLEGPYGNCSLNLDSDDEYQIFLLISGGIGVTRLNSLCNSLKDEYNKGRNLKKIIMVWSVREKEIYESFLENNEEILKKSVQKNENIVENYYHFTGKVEELRKSEFFELKTGRPNLEDYFIMAKDYANQFQKKKIAVLSAGPVKMMEETLNLAKKWSKEGVSFDSHQELLEF